MTPRRTAACAIALVLLLAGAPGCRLPRETAAEVNGTPITAAELEAEARAFTSQFGQMPPALEQSLPQVRRGILDRLIDRELMLQEARRRGIRPAPQEVEAALARSREGMTDRELDAALAEAGTDREGWRRSTEGDLAIERLQRDLAAAAAVSEQEVGERLARTRPPRDVPEEVRASQILVRTEAEAQEARRRIAGGEGFGEVARLMSASPDAERGGDLGWFARGRMPPEFDAAVFALPAGRPSGVVETAYGFHLFLVTDRRAQRTRSDDELRGEARASLLAEKRDAAFRQWLAAARAAAKIKVNRALVPD